MCTTSCYLLGQVDSAHADMSRVFRRSAALPIHTVSSESCLAFTQLPLVDAGGLLVGATANLRPELFCALLASVPFLDAAGTLQDSSLPLTANEWEEFGNPNEADGFESVFGFSPVHNVKPRAKYPKCLLLPALNDARTGFWEASKFADRIRTNGYAHAEASHTQQDEGRVEPLHDEGEDRQQQQQQPQQPDQP
eukprot:5682543-Pleurochrysis_carterae.AAC.3